MQHLQSNTTLQGGKYRIERVLGQGGFGNTYVGYNTEFEETVAIKEFFMKGVTERDESTRSVSVSNSENVQQFEEQREKFKKEARRLRKLRNEHIVKVHDLFEENGTAYYVMDYIDGENLSERLKRTGMPLSEVEVRDVLIQVLDALKEVHQNEIWHLDLKPGNIMLDKSDKVYLIDFGASKQIRANGSMTTSTALCYTPGYAPNEQVGQMYDRFGPWTDIYALGATIYNLLTNKKPPMAIDIEEDEEDAFVFPSSISQEMRELVIWMMQPKRKKRPQDVDEIIAKMTASSVPREQLQFNNDKEETIVSAFTQNDQGIYYGDEGIDISQSYFRERLTCDEEKTIINGCASKSLQVYHRIIKDDSIIAVDLGLSVFWANQNIGKQITGGLYGWGDSIGNKTSQDCNDYLDYRGGLYLATPQNISGSQYDLATQKWGNRWRIPSKKHWDELINKCKWEIIKEETFKGYLITGPNGNSIFLPVTGLRYAEKVTNPYSGYYWTSELVDDDVKMAYYYYFDNDKHNDNVNTRNYIYTGRAIRPICDRQVCFL